MTPAPTPDQLFQLLATPDPQELAFRVAVAEKDLRPDRLSAAGTAYKDQLWTTRPRLAEFGDYIQLDKVTQGPPGYLYYYFGRDKTAEELRTPYKVVQGSRHYDWPTVLHAVAFAEDAEYPVTETRPGGRTVQVPRLRARAIKTEGAFALCKTATKFYLGARPFAIPTHPQPVAGLVTWVLNNTEESLSCLHTDLDLPARGSNWNVTNVAGDATVATVPAQTRNFPSTPLADWHPFVMRDDQDPLESGLYERVVTILYPPTSAELSSL